ncbi:MAG: response regulator [Chloroflexota bacterium]
MKPCVLVVDDEADTRNLFRFTLEYGGFTVREAIDGEDALAQIENGRPDVVLLDVMMPRLDGYEVCKRLRQQAETADLPIIMVSAKSQAEAIETGLALGATDYLTKPVALETLINSVRAAVQQTASVPC